ncbi:hypothetical protein N8J89_39725 [Crossiella sp. CA-258035]|uniref:hypothetical protein n=1 Tax=Crossiella sp. CA-258035 TaxID=2981138 RepID=UPI0024BC7F72|nr:hypothetical protein [Crossiella sp. CA-258035]WHT19154.1 hypothetical protein N8J89_39725 [Crossiella sp. CA-258035]
MLKSAPRLEILEVEPRDLLMNRDVASLLDLKALRQLDIVCADPTILGPLRRRPELQVIWRPRNDSRPAALRGPWGD